MSMHEADDLQGGAHAGRRGGGDRRRCLLILLTVALLAAYAIGQVVLWADTLGRDTEAYVRWTTDLTIVLTAGSIIRAGDGPRLYDPATQHAAQADVLAPYVTLGEGKLLPYNHPPWQALLVAPVMDLPYGTIYLLWTLLGLLALGLAIWLLLDAVPVSGAARWILLAAVAAYRPLHIALWLGQNSPFVLLGVCGAYAAVKRRREGWAGVALVLVALKPQLFPVLVLLVWLQGYQKALLVCGGLLAGLSVAAMGVLGVEWPLRYARFLALVSSREEDFVIGAAGMQTLRGLALSLLGGSAPALVVPVFVGLALAALGALLWAAWSVRGAARGRGANVGGVGMNADLLWSLAIVVAVLIAPHLNAHDLIVLILPGWLITASVIAGAWDGKRARLWFLIAGAVYLPFPVVELAGQPLLWAIPPTVLALSLAVVLLAWRLVGLRRAGGSRWLRAAVGSR